ncbi:acyl-CoA dehydrogenase family protein [Sabulicella rubraurantiaca]|uniref:acyl-CoA dehydrogenase family protein n=1 Tax=Sabulicella rubraurantiaca TaxID=2811429 RepID=UPI001A9690B1|nr:acyl-CoA dehydrogenase family protein [Sabulicella rubraurantiaca]
MSADPTGLAPFSEDRAESIGMIRDSAQGLLGADMARVRKLRFTEPGFDPALVREMGAAGWIGLMIEEAKGGTGLGHAEMAALAEELGRACAPEPLTSLQLSAALLAAAGHDLLPQMLSGEAIVLTAWQDRPNTLEPATGDGPRRFVPMAAGATHFLFVSGGNLHLLPASDVTLETEQRQDGGHFGTVRPKGALPAPIATGLGEAIAAALDRAALATAAELLGGMEASFAMTLDYLRTRKQFGTVIGKFQALQHKAADARVQLSLARAAVEEAAFELDEGTGGPAIVARAKARASDAAMAVQQAALQLHGGIGYTDEYDQGLHLRRAMVLVPSFGGAALHRARFMALEPETEDA